MTEFDIAVIGAGSTGLQIAMAAAQFGLRTALIEQGAPGGAMLHQGGLAARALLETAHVVLAAREAGRLGIGLAAPEIEWPALRARLSGVIAAAAAACAASRLAAFGVTLIGAQARFGGRDTLLLRDGEAGVERRLVVPRIVIAAGSLPVWPQIEGLATAPVLTRAELVGLATLPAHLLILGGDGAALELAQGYAALGARVTLVAPDGLAPDADAELVGGLRLALRRQGVVLREGIRVRLAGGAAGAPALVLEDGSQLHGGHLLLSMGRRPALDGLDLAAGSVRAGAGGIVTDAGLRSPTNRRVFAAGSIADPEGRGAHEGGRGSHVGVVIRRAVFRLPSRVDASAPSRVIETRPALAQVGLTEAAARRAGLDIRVLRASLADTALAGVEARPEGLVKLIVTGKGRILGAGLLGPHARDAVIAWALAIAHKLPLSAMAGLDLPRFSAAEAGQAAASGLLSAALSRPRIRRAAKLLSRLP